MAHAIRRPRASRPLQRRSALAGSLRRAARRAERGTRAGDHPRIRTLGRCAARRRAVHQSRLAIASERDAQLVHRPARESLSLNSRRTDSIQTWSRPSSIRSAARFTPGATLTITAPAGTIYYYARWRGPATARRVAVAGGAHLRRQHLR